MYRERYAALLIDGQAQRMIGDKQQTVGRTTYYIIADWHIQATVIVRDSTLQVLKFTIIICHMAYADLVAQDQHRTAMSADKSF